MAVAVAVSGLGPDSGPGLLKAIGKRVQDTRV